MKKNSKKRILLAFVTMIFVFAFVLMVSEEIAANSMVSPTAAQISVPGAGSRVLVIAPHPDDETLGAGLLIKKTITNGGQVKVVLMTNGDGYRVAAHLDYAKVTLTPKEYIDFGYLRQQESLKALKLLGVSEDNVIFLGYPDGGLASLWSSNWNSSVPYTSINTLSDRSPYINSFYKDRLYCGQNVVDDLSKIIADYQPTMIVMPHPNDRHPDHWATNAFMKYTLTVMDYTPQQEWLYLVHRGLWPTPEASTKTNEDMAPPAKLLNIGTAWYALDLTDQEVSLKSNAIQQYHSQLKTLGYQMSCFAKGNELFGQYPDTVLIRGLRQDSKVTPNSANEIIQDPSQDKLRLDVDKSADILAVHAEISTEGNVHLFMHTDKPIEKLCEYRFNLVTINKEKSSHLTFVVKGNKINVQDPSSNSVITLSGIRVSSKDNDLELVVPQSALGDCDHIFIDAETAFNHIQTDKTAWRMLD